MPIVTTAWITPWTTDNGKDIGLATLSFRTLADSEVISGYKTPVELHRFTDIAAAIKNGEIHYTLSVLDHDSLVILYKAIGKYLYGS